MMFRSTHTNNNNPVADELASALKAVVHNASVRSYMQTFDPRALEQARRAVAHYEEAPK